MNVQIQPGCRVVLHLRITLGNGVVVEDTFAEEPLDFVMRDGTLAPTLELGLYGMEAGQKQTLTLAPEQAFGVHDPAQVREMPRSQFSADLPLEPGVIMEFTTPDGEAIPGAILRADAETVTVDFNHPLAGKPIIFETEILSVEPPGDDSFTE